MSAIRLARGFTGRELVVKFAGCYHGHVDSLLAQAGSGLATFSVPGTPGVPAASTAATLVLPYNDPEALAAAFAEHGDDIACVITEAAPGNMGVVPPRPGFNRLLAETCRAHGALFVSDEVMTGFRVTRSGHWGLDGAVEGWAPDLTTYGKVMGGGFPAAAFGGRADVMSMLSPEGPVYQAGHALGEPGRDHRRPGHPAGSRPPRSTRTSTAPRRWSARRPAPPWSRPASRTSSSTSATCSACSSPIPGVTEVPDFAAASAQHPERYKAFFHAMLDQGVYLPPSAFEVWFLSAAHDDRALDRILSALAGRRPRRGRRRRHAKGPDERPDHRAPAAPRRGAQPRGRALRPPARLPPLRARPEDGAADRRRRRRPGHHPRRGLAARARAGDGRARWPWPGASTSSPTRG